MATTKKRITISLGDLEYAAVSRMAKVGGSPVSSVISELLAEVAPMLNSMADMAEQAIAAQDEVRSALRRAVDRADAEVMPQVQAVFNRLEELRHEMRKAADGVRDSAKAGLTAPASGPALKNPRPVITGVRNGQRRGGARGKKGVIFGCTCTMTAHERQENPACPVHFRRVRP
jgi:outer membrane murein-binding lipoprotein Lpp